MYGLQLPIINKASEGYMPLGMKKQYAPETICPKNNMPRNQYGLKQYAPKTICPKDKKPPEDDMPRR